MTLILYAFAVIGPDEEKRKGDIKNGENSEKKKTATAIKKDKSGDAKQHSKSLSKQAEKKSDNVVVKNTKENPSVKRKPLNNGIKGNTTTKTTTPKTTKTQTNYKPGIPTTRSTANKMKEHPAATIEKTKPKNENHSNNGKSHAKTSPKKRSSQDGKSSDTMGSQSGCGAENEEPKHKFCDVAVIVDDEDTSQKADQICEYIKRRGRVFVVRQPRFASQNKEGKGGAAKISEAKEEFKRMVKQSKIVLVLVNEAFKTNHASLECCAYADRLMKPTYPLLMEGTGIAYEPSCLLDLMLGNKNHYKVGVHYEQEMEKVLQMIKDKIKT